jgi:YHS domain-containing protein
MIERRVVAPSEDPVCAMTVDAAEAQAGGLVLTHEGDVYGFCSRGCLLEFRDDPAWFLDPAYTPTMD